MSAPFTPDQAAHADECELDARSVRMECLRLASRNERDAGDAVAKAQAFADFVLAAKRGE